MWKFLCARLRRLPSFCLIHSPKASVEWGDDLEAAGRIDACSAVLDSHPPPRQQSLALSQSISALPAHAAGCDVDELIGVSINCRKLQATKCGATRCSRALGLLFERPNGFEYGVGWAGVRQPGLISGLTPLSTSALILQRPRPGNCHWDDRICKYPPCYLSALLAASRLLAKRSAPSLSAVTRRLCLCRPSNFCLASRLRFSAGIVKLLFNFALFTRQATSALAGFVRLILSGLSRLENSPELSGLGTPCRSCYAETLPFLGRTTL